MFRTYKEKKFCLILTFNIKTFRLNWLDIWFASPYIVYLLFKIKQNYITLKATSFYWQLPEKQIFSSPDLNSSSQLKHVNIFNLHHFSRFIFTLRNWSEANLPKQLINPAQFVPILISISSARTNVIQGSLRHAHVTRHATLIVVRCERGINI